MAHNVINFGAGPAKLPQEVLEQSQRELVNYHGTGISILETSHRSKDYGNINDGAQVALRQLLNVPANYKILFMQGGGTGMFAAVPLNLMARTGKADYIVTGTWSSKAADEARKYGDINLVLPATKNYTNIPDTFEWKLSTDAAYVYYCDNETVHGVEFAEIPDTKGVPLVADMSSNFLTRKFDITKFGVVFAGAQKNVGPAGVTVVIVREDLLNAASPVCPTVLNFSVMAKDNSLHNTPPVFAIYMMHLVFLWLLKEGGLDEMQRRCHAKSSALMDVVKTSNGFYSFPVDARVRSRINVPFRISGDQGAQLEEKFLAEAAARGMIQLRGHRSVGGIRASLYNAVSVEEAQKLAKLMQEFYESNK